MGRISRYARTSPHPPAHSLHEIACVNSLAAGYAALGRARVLKQLGGARGTSGSRRCECGVWAGHQSCPISSASGSKGAVGIICRCRYSVCLSTTHNTLWCTHNGCRTFYGSDPEMPRLSLCIGLGIPVLVVHCDLAAAGIRLQCHIGRSSLVFEQHTWFLDATDQH